MTDIANATCAHHWIISEDRDRSRERWLCRRCGAAQEYLRPVVRPRPAQRMRGATWSREELIVAGLLSDD
jgi:hypothetical protein